MNIGIIGGGINGLCCAWQLAKLGHEVQIYEKNSLMSATSRSSSKLLHGGLRYLENREFRLVRESLRERDAWIKRAPQLAKPLRLVIPIYKTSRRPGWLIGMALFLYDHLAGKSLLPKAKRLTAQELMRRDQHLNPAGLQYGFEFSDGQMDDLGLGLWVADQSKKLGVHVAEKTEITKLTAFGELTTASGITYEHDRVINVAGPWAHRLLQKNNLKTPYELDLVRGSHIVLNQPCTQAYLLEVPNEQRIFFVLPKNDQTLIGTTEVRQDLDDPIACDLDEERYLLDAWSQYFPNRPADIIDNFSGLRPLLRSDLDPTKATREYAIHRHHKLINVLGGKWTTALALANKVTNIIH